MPNWCDNSITIKGPTEGVEAFWTEYSKHCQSDSDEGPIANFVPMPAELSGTQSPVPTDPDPHPNWGTLLRDGKMTQEWYDEITARRREDYERAVAVRETTGYASWLDWQHSNWGIKWGDSETQLNPPYESSFARFDTQVIEGYYQTPWGPFRTEFWEQISSRFPSLSFVIVWSEEGMAQEGAMAFKDGKCVYDRTQNMQASLLEDAEQALEEV